MPNLSRETQAALLRQLQHVREQLEQKYEYLYFEKRIALFENQQTLREIEACLSLDDNELELKNFLAKRWDRICDSFVSYTQNPFNLVNRFCLQIAKELSPLPEGEEAINQLGDKEGPYFLLMPSLMACKDIQGDNIHLLELYQFILSDNAQTYIPLKACLEYAADSDVFRHVVSENQRDYPLLSPKEMESLSEYSNSLQRYVNAVTNYHSITKDKEFLDGRLVRLKTALVAGGAHAGAEEMNAGSAANHGILEFAEYWATVPLEQQEGYYIRYPGLKDIIGRLLRPNDADYRDVNYCVELIAMEMEGIIAHIARDRENMEARKRAMTECKGIFERDLSAPSYPMSRPKGKMPRVLAMIYTQLNAQQQEEMFQSDKYSDAQLNAQQQEEKVQRSKCSDAWSYVLQEAPQSLFEFKDILTPKMREKDLSLKFEEGLTLLMKAVQADGYDTVNMLLDFPTIDINARNKGMTALLYAAEQKNFPILNLLLAKGAEIKWRNWAGLNAFNILNVFIRERGLSTELLLPLLVNVASLNLEQQADILGNPFDAWTYTLRHYPDLIPALLNQIIEQNYLQVLRNRHSLPRAGGATTLISAVMHGNRDLVRLLLDCLPAALDCLPIDLLQETDEIHNDAALSWAAYEGKADIVALLLDRGAIINARGNTGNTALHYAARKRHGDIVMSLLQREADMTIRNDAGNNAFEIALANLPDLTVSLLIHASTLNAERQRELLARINGGRGYINVLDYVLCEKVPLWDELRQNPAFPISEELRAISGETLSRIMEAKRDFKNRLDDLRIKHQDLLDRDEAEASQVTLQLYTDLQREGATFFSEPTPTNFRNFRTNCTLAFDAARPVLEKHRGYTYYFANFALFFAGLGLVNLANKAITGNFFFFPPTESVKKMNEIHDVVDRCEMEIQL